MNSSHWRSSAVCDESIDFFSEDPSVKYEARALCHGACPVRWECLQNALTNKEIWGVWGGVDEYEIRRALSVNRHGEPVRRARAPRCPYCSKRSLDVVVKKRARYKVECSICKMTWWIKRAPRAAVTRNTEQPA